MDTDVNFICKIDRELYRVVDQDLVTDDVIITEQQILHIEDGHPGDYDRLSSHIPLILQEPDYILRGNRPHTALVLKEIVTPELTAEVVLRLKVSDDPEDYKILSSPCGISVKSVFGDSYVKATFFTKKNNCGMLYIG